MLGVFVCGGVIIRWLWGRCGRLRRLSVGINHSNINLVHFGGKACSSIISLTIIIFDQHLIHGDSSEDILVINDAFGVVISNKGKVATSLTVIAGDLNSILQELVGIK